MNDSSKTAGRHHSVYSTIPRGPSRLLDGMADGPPLEMRAMASDETEEWLDLLGEAFAAKVRVLHRDTPTPRRHHDTAGHSVSHCDACSP